MKNITFTAFSLLLFLISLSTLPIPSLSSSLSSSSLSLNLTETVFDILDRYNLPRGLLPDAIETYTFNPSNGRLVVRLRPLVCTFNRGQTLWRYNTRDIMSGRQLPLNIDLSRDLMVVRTGSGSGSVSAALDPPFTNTGLITRFWRRDLVDAQGGITDSLWLAPPPNYRIVYTAPFRQVMRCNTNTNTDVM